MLLNAYALLDDLAYDRLSPALYKRWMGPTAWLNERWVAREQRRWVDRKVRQLEVALFG